MHVNIHTNLRSKFKMVCAGNLQLYTSVVCILRQVEHNQEMFQWSGFS